MLPSFSTMTIVPVSAMPKLTPLMPTSAEANRSRSVSRAVLVSSPMSSVGGIPSSVVKSCATCRFVLCIAGAMMCE
jgi:hypothetical protein